MIQLFAPFPDIKTLIILPSPTWGDFIRSNNIVELKKNIVGTLLRTYVTKIETKTLELSFTLTRMKSLELLRFYDLHSADKMQLVLHDATIHYGYLQVNPLELEKTQRALVASSVEGVSIKLNFETV